MTDRPVPCPSCLEGGAPVERVTLKALLTSGGLRRGIPVRPHYCGRRDCPVVYFDPDGGASFTEADLEVPVFAKHPDDEAMLVCYCFDVTVGAMKSDRARELRESVAREVKAGRCGCEVRNPKGGCCLGDLVRLERGRETDAPPSCCAT